MATPEASSNRVIFNGPVTLAANKSLTVNALGTIALTSAPGTTSHLTASGTGAISLTTARNVTLVDGSSITTVDGGITLEANQQAVPTSGDFVGVNVAYARIETSGSGAVTVRGRGGVGEAGNQFGVRVMSGGKILGGTTLPLTVVGTGGASAEINNLGVVVTAAQSQISSAGGDVSVTGTGGGVGNSIFNYGVRVAAAAELTAGGSGTVTVIGHGGNSEGTGDHNYGVSVGVNNARISSGGGSISVTGTAGSGSTRFGIALMSNGQIVATTGTPTVTLVADRMDLETSSSLIDAGGNTVLLRQLTEGRAINLGGDDSGQLSLTDAELDRINAGVLQIGDRNSGTITVSADITRAAATNMELHTGGDIVLSGGQIDTGGGTLLLDSGASPAAVKPTKTGTDVTASTLSFGSDLAIVIDGTTADTQYTQLNVAGIVNLTGVDLKISGTYTPVPTDSFVIVANDSSDAVLGTFTGYAEGATVNVNGTNKRITYIGGGGNDVALEPIDLIPPTVTGTTPSFAASGTVAAGATSLVVNFSEAMLGGATAGNFQLRRAGADGLLGTGDDPTIVVTASYAANSTTLTFAGLVEDVYRLTVRDTLIDLVGNQLDGDANSTAGGDWNRDFVVGALSTTLTSPSGYPFDIEYGGFGARGNSCKGRAGRLMVWGGCRSAVLMLNPIAQRLLTLSPRYRILVLSRIFSFPHRTRHFLRHFQDSAQRSRLRTLPSATCSASIWTWRPIIKINLR